MKSIRGTFGLHAGADASVFRALLGEPGTTARDVRAPPRVIRACATASDGKNPTIRRFEWAWLGRIRPVRPARDSKKVKKNG